MPENHKSTLRRFVDEVINKGNLSLIDTIVDKSYVYHGSGGQELRGPEGARQLVSMYRTAFPDLQMTMEDFIVEGDKSVMRWKARGTHKGQLAGIAPTGKSAAVTGIVISRWTGSKIAEEWEAFDEVSLLRQLGVHTIPTAAHA